MFLRALALVCVLFSGNTALSGWLFSDFDQEDENIYFKEVYIQPNEFQNYRYKQILSQNGGVYLGVGTFRTLNLAAEVNFDYLILFDANRRVSWFNRANIQLILESKSRAEYLHNLTGLPYDIIELVQDQKDRIGLVAGDVQLSQNFRRSRFVSVLEGILGYEDERILHETLMLSEDILYSRFSNFFFTSDARFKKIRDLVIEDKVSVVAGSIDGDKSIFKIASVLAENGMKIKAMDLSNALDYIDDKLSILRVLENIKLLSFDQDSKILLTESHRDSVQLVFRNVINSDYWNYFGYDPDFFIQRMAEIVETAEIQGTKMISMLFQNALNAVKPLDFRKISVLEEDCDGILDR